MQIKSILNIINPIVIMNSYLYTSLNDSIIKTVDRMKIDKARQKDISKITHG